MVSCRFVVTLCLVAFAGVCWHLGAALLWSEVTILGGLMNILEQKVDPKCLHRRECLRPCCLQ